MKQIFEALVVIADEIDATPGLSADGSEALGDTLDALTGMCHRDCQYQDPSSVTLPTAESRAGTAADNEIKPVG